MHMRTWLNLLLAAFTLFVAVAFLLEWRSARQDSARLQVQLDQAEQLFQQTVAAQQQRDKQLSLTLAQLNSLKSSVKSQHDILQALPSVLPLPKPVTAQTGNLGSGAPPMDKPTNLDAPQPPTLTALPPEDLKPLYDFALDCKACQARLSATTADLADEKTKTQALRRERDAALQVARGGSLRQRIKRSTKWLLLGAVAGAIAAKANSH
jgi:hypothetical protein